MMNVNAFARGSIMPRQTAVDLERFVTAQEPVLARVLAELAAGRKQSHWMWFIFPQMRGLGHSHMAEIYGLSSLDEARAYLAHPLLGPRLRQCVQLSLDAQGALHEIFGSPDDMKFCSSMSLFALAADPQPSIFRDALGRFCAGKLDARTVDLLRSAGQPSSSG